MSRIPLGRNVVLLLLVLVVAAPFASAAAQPDRTVHSAAGRFEASALLSRLMSWLTGVWEKNGCSIDPNGRCLPGTGASPAPPVGPDNGFGIDPGGRRHPVASPLQAADNGCAIDPWGRCGS